MSTVSTMEAVQAVIDARQTAEAIEYGIRSIKVCRGVWGSSACHRAQIVAACQAATRVTGEFVTQDAGTARKLRAAKRVAGEQVKAAVAAQREIGTVAQIRMAMAA